VGQIKLRRIPDGEFMMGSLTGEGDNDEHPQHQVRITRPFYLGVYEVTQGQYRAVMGQTPSNFKGSDDLPVETVSWRDAVQFCNTLSEKEGMKPFYEIDGESVRIADWNGTGYRLPTEAEWEYACRAGSNTKYSFGDDEKNLSAYAWFDGNSENKTHPVGQRQRNSWDLYDMHGNVWEWCWDWFTADYYQGSPTDDPRGPLGASPRVFRGGGWSREPRSCRSADRRRFEPGLRGSALGFRLALGQSGR
jgi:formylglycine-generating enzyme required for sulfatase activity